MKAVVCEAFGGPEVLALRELPDPPPPGPGEVVAVGDGVTRFKVGDRIMNRMRLGAFGTLANSKEIDCDPVPNGMSLEAAAVFRGAYHTAYHALIQRGRLQKS